jgi:hypothetical protein
VSEVPPPPPPTGPSHIGRYAVRRRIGSGGFATVWLGYDEQLDAPVAIKVLADNWAEQHEVRNRFVEEGRYLRRVESPHVVPVYDAGSLDDGRPYLVMAYADQGTLSDRLQQGGVTVPQALEVVAQVGAGLQALHDRGVLHRDVKPANVLFRTVDPAGGVGGVRAMVGDLGLGKALDVSSRLTMIAGTPAYVAPEQAQGETPDPRADQFSLGVLTFQLLSGRLPWQHASLPAAAAASDPAELSTADRVFPDSVEQVVRRALAHDRQWRWPSVSAYVEALTHEVETASAEADGAGTRYLPVDPQLTQPGARPSPHSDPGDPLPEPVLPATRRRRGRVVGAVAAVLVALAAGAVGGYAAYGAARDEPAPPGDVTVVDSTDTISVVVPARWDASEGVDGWVPSGSDGDTAPALSVGTTADWSTAEGGEGVFVGLLQSEELPDEVPQHPECATVRDQGRDRTPDGDDMMTSFFVDCPQGIVVERLVQITQDQVLWVQLRSADKDTAEAVLDSVSAF